MSKRFTCSIVLGFSLLFGISTPNLKADEEITTENINEQKTNDYEEQKVGTRYFNLEDDLEDEVDVEEFQENSDDECVIKEELTSTQATLQRTFFKSIIETISTHLGHKQNALSQKATPNETISSRYKIVDFHYNELGKILSNLLIDETIPNPKSNTTQKLIELMAPTIIAFLIIDCAQESFIQNNKFQKSDNKIEQILSLSPKLSTNLLCKLVRKLLMVRFLQKPGTRKYQILNALAMLSAFFEINTQGKSFQEKYCSFDCIDGYHGVEQLFLDQCVRVPIELIDLGKHLNPRHRKKAFAKVIQILLKPNIVQAGIKKFYDYKNPLAG